MYNKETSKRLLAYVSAAALISSNALAATQSVTANIAFDTVLALTKVHDIDFGTVKAGQSGTYTIDTTGAVSASGGGVWISGTPQEGEITITGSSTQTINISVGGYTANSGVTPSNAQCDYNGGGEGSCSISGGAAPGAGKTLLIGVDAAVSGAQAAGSSATPSFTVTVVYS